VSRSEHEGENEARRGADEIIWAACKSLDLIPQQSTALSSVPLTRSLIVCSFVRGICHYNKKLIVIFVTSIFFSHL
jgi:hypothetical protein